jgi:NDP-sugar pyrophosphorylase family protein
MGTMGPLRAIPNLPENFLVMNGDVLTDLNFATFHDEHINSNQTFTISSHKRVQKIDYGVLMSNASGFLCGFQEKPSTNYEVSMGVYMANREILHYVPDAPYGFDDLMIDLLADKHDIKVEAFSGYWLDIGRPDDYMQAIDEFEKMKSSFLYE